MLWQSVCLGSINTPESTPFLSLLLALFKRDLIERDYIPKGPPDPDSQIWLVQALNSPSRHGSRPGRGSTLKPEPYTQHPTKPCRGLPWIELEVPFKLPEPAFL